ncbi:MAG: endonuclease V [Deltaproteobacteria bacterium]|nr:endonuclease V [Deltaproteobacteria bacterium]
MSPAAIRVLRLHPWRVSPHRAAAIQEALAGHLRLRDGPRRLRLVAGADAAYDQAAPLVHAAVVVLAYPDLTLVEQRAASLPVTFPYIPGLLAFREGPALLRAFEALTVSPDLLFFNGHGIAHPRGLGLASHLGILLRTPAIGCALQPLLGSFQEPPPQAGAFTWVRSGRHVVGAALRSRTAVRPIFVSPGYRLSVRRAVRLTLTLCRGFRLPEPLRWAHQAANRQRALHAAAR